MQSCSPDADWVGRKLIWAIIYKGPCTSNLRSVVLKRNDPKLWRAPAPMGQKSIKGKVYNLGNPLAQCSRRISMGQRSFASREMRV